MLSLWVVGPSAQSTLKLDTGKEIFQAGCVSCHGPDGKGQTDNLAGFEKPATFPDFSDCPTSTPEANVQWKSIITNGGRARGFSEIMPSFRDQLTPDQIDKVVGYLRSLCTEPKWPLGNFNLPRPLITEKAFPENETVVTTSIDRKSGEVGQELVFEKRFGARTNFETRIPFTFLRNDVGTWDGGFGDVSAELKRVLLVNPKRGSMVSASGEVNFPTGNAKSGHGTGVTILEPYLVYAQLLPHSAFVQFQTGVEVPTRRDTGAVTAAFWRTALGKSFYQDGGLGRSWTPMVEVIADRDYYTGSSTNWSVVPEMQVTLSKRQHIRANIGWNIPTNNRPNRSAAVMSYLLWDWFDGGFLDGWR
ncbi:MAG: cytochrome c [Acidobacteriota bacterium]